ncbi:MAG: FAD-dependent monooxygenase [Methylovirgula sp.]
MSDAPHALIAGAGIGGLTAALCLARAGFRVSLFERAKVLQEVGAGLQISPNASSILRDLGVLPHVSGALAPQALNIRRGRDGDLLQSLPLQDAERRWGAPYLFIHRADLHNALLETVRRNPAISITADTEIAGFFPGKDSIDVETRANGSTQRVKGDCLIGADGLRSAVRRELSARRLKTRGAGWPPLPDHARHLAWRTLIDANDVAPAFRRPESTLWLGSKAHIVNYPLREGSVINVIAVVEAPVAIDWNVDIWSQNGAAETIAARFCDWSREVRDLIGAARDWRTWPLVDLDPLPEWTSGRVALLGDAAHPMLPFLAQGAAQAIEDAAMLGAMLSPQSPIEPCLAAYAAARRPRANRVQSGSRRQAKIYHLGEPAAFFRDIALRAMSQGQLLGQYDWLYRVRPDVK